MTGPSSGRPEVILNFYLPPEQLRPFITTIYRFDVVEGHESAEQEICDWLHPEWANLRIAKTGVLKAVVGLGNPQPIPPLVLTGPTSHSTTFRAPPCETWGIGILPLGWLRLIGTSAHHYADRAADVAQDDTLAHLRVLGDFGANHSIEAQLATIISRLEKLLAKPHRREAAVVAVQQALVDPQNSTVRQLTESLGMSVRTLERLSREVFGFSPSLLLRRQRFLRSLAQFMLDPSMSWIDTLDPQYYDQAQFTRDFKRFMGMGPREYASLDHPVLMAAAKARLETAGAPMQVLHEPASPPAV